MSSLFHRIQIQISLAVILSILGALPAYSHFICDLPYYNALGGDLSMRDFNGKPFNINKLQGNIKWVYFGYTSCPDACPTAMANFKRLLSFYGEEKDNISILFVTIDPLRDSNERLKKYLGYFGPNFIGLRGSEVQTRQAAQSFGVSYNVASGKSAMGKIFNHTDRYFLVDQDGKLRGVYSPEETDKLSADTSLMYWAERSLTTTLN